MIDEALNKSAYRTGEVIMMYKMFLMLNVASGIFAMEIPLPAVPRETNSVKVLIVGRVSHYDIPINNDTVIADIKQRVNEREGGRMPSMEIAPLMLVGFRYNYGPLVSDNSNVRELIQCWRTDLFIVLGRNAVQAHEVFYGGS